ncbi:MAG: SDR family NAD(P)-dependent oxidoreductase, partial [Rubrivivax sp.]
MNPPTASYSSLARFRVEGRVAVVTGGAQGIGLAAAQALHEAGATVVLLDRDLAAAQQAAAALPGSQALALDVADAPAIERVLGEVAQRHGRIDIL